MHLDHIHKAGGLLGGRLGSKTAALERLKMNGMTYPPFDRDKPLYHLNADESRSLYRWNSGSNGV